MHVVLNMEEGAGLIITIGEQSYQGATASVNGQEWQEEGRMT